MNSIFESSSALAHVQSRLQRYARRQVRNDTLAEDAVSETLLAALEHPRQFESAAHATAWLFGVLKHKLVDQLRAQHREVPVGDPLPESGDHVMSWSGAWTDHRAPANSPQVACELNEFSALLQRCCEKLPPTQSRAFVMRELLDLDTETICQGLDVTEGHLWVLLHRARARLKHELAAYRSLTTGRLKENAVA